MFIAKTPLMPVDYITLNDDEKQLISKVLLLFLKL